ncbi:hypothetical protein CD797_32410 [Pseudomonas aeruginosa]|uniref:hypothetical protein n=1 Tax=Pseudomonas aeruginosa TaxID=287 RepID=UPI000B4DC75F|nr:hypothetical protein [Pseudomonas aeruginosa]ASD06968.1 hypothetical protein CD797_32410 [Pseudomonas aeruginosa]
MQRKKRLTKREIRNLEDEIPAVAADATHAAYLRALAAGHTVMKVQGNYLVETKADGSAIVAQANRGDKGFLSKDITVRDMLTHHGDIHHIFPKNFLKQRGLRSKYNQVANYVYVQQEVNIKIGDTARPLIWRRSLTSVSKRSALEGVQNFV